MNGAFTEAGGRKHGKEGVNGSSPLEGFEKPRIAGLFRERDLRDLLDAQLWSTLWSSRVENDVGVRLLESS